MAYVDDNVRKPIYRWVTYVAPHLTGHGRWMLRRYPRPSTTCVPKPPDVLHTVRRLTRA